MVQQPRVADLEEETDAKKEISAFQSASEAATQSAVRSVEERRENPELADKIRDPDVDTDRHDGVEDEMGAFLSRQFAFGNRPSAYEEASELLAANYAERLIIEKTPGRLLREHPLINAVMQRVDGADDPEFVEPLQPGDLRSIYQAAAVGANIRSLAVNGKGIDALMTATVENRQVSTEHNEEQSARERARELIK